MRTLSAELEAALDSGQFVFNMLLSYRDTASPGTVYEGELIKYKITDEQFYCEAIINSFGIFNNVTPSDWQFKITRGVTINGVDYTISTSWFYGKRFTYKDGYLTQITATLLPNTSYTDTSANTKTYQQVIENLLTTLGKTASYVSPSSWKGYDFMPTTETLDVVSAMDILGILKKKGLVYATDNGNEDILFHCVANTHPPFGYEYDIVAAKSIISQVKVQRRLMTVDENGTIVYSGETDAKRLNLGYRLSTDSHPTNAFSFVKWEIMPTVMHLKYQTFDKVRHYISEDDQNQFMAQVTEEINLDATPAWQTKFYTFNWAESE